MAERLLIGTFMGVEFYADPQVPSGTVVFENAKPSEPEVDYACGGTDIEPPEQPDPVIARLELACRVLGELRVLEIFNESLGSEEPDPMAITRSIARGP